VEHKSDALNIGGSTHRIQSPKEEYLKLFSSLGLSKDLIYFKIHSSHDSLFSRIAQKTIAIADIEKIEKNADFYAVAEVLEKPGNENNCHRFSKLVMGIDLISFIAD